LEAALDELLALAARNARGEIDLFDRQRSMVAERARQIIRPSRDDHIEHVLPGKLGILVHAKILSIRPLRIRESS
jgi:hypothetical protein